MSVSTSHPVHLSSEPSPAQRWMGIILSVIGVGLTFAALLYLFLHPSERIDIAEPYSPSRSNETEAATVGPDGANKNESPDSVAAAVEVPDAANQPALVTATRGSEPLKTGTMAKTDESILDGAGQFAASLPPNPLETEKTGGTGMTSEKLPDLPQAPQEVIDACEKYSTNQLDENLRLRAKEGPSKCDFSVDFDGMISNWTLMTIPKLPQELLTLNVIEPSASAKFSLHAKKGKILEKADGAWTWEAPDKPGIYCVRITEETKDQSMCFHVAVMHPWEGEETLNGYRIGQYQDKPFQDNPRYRKPRGFIEINEKDMETWLSPHFQVKQFVCKQRGDFPKYMLVQPLLLLKLETLIQKLESHGVVDTESLYITSGYRTPFYNQAIGNKTYYSRHLYGDAADLFVDVNRDGKMDDIDRNGWVDGDDARVLERLVKEITTENRQLVGGLGFYDKVNYRNPFIHVDTRGYPARWSR